MSLVLVKETGAGLANANSYASASDGDGYHDGHLYASTWTAASTGNRGKALVMATRLIDGSYQFNGVKSSGAQSLQWPRFGAIDPDRKEIQFSTLDSRLGPYFESDRVPAALVSATCEMARELLLLDRTAAPDGEGIKQLTVVGALSVTYDRRDRLPVISHLTQTLLEKLGTLLVPGSGTARLVRT